MNRPDEYEVHYTNKSQHYTIFHPNHLKFCEIIGTRSFAYCTPVTSNQGHGQLDYNQDVESKSIYHYTNFEANRFINTQMHAHIKAF